MNKVLERDRQIKDAVESLATLPFFHNVARAKLNDLAVKLEEKVFKGKQMIFRQGELEDCLYIIKSGQVEIFSVYTPYKDADVNVEIQPEVFVAESVKGTADKRIILAILGEGDFLGELSLLDGRPRSANALALKPVTAYVVRRTDFLDFFKNNIEVASEIMRVMAERLRRTNNIVEDVCFLDVSARLAKRLLILADFKYGVEGDKRELSVTITQKELAAMVGATRESINRQLHRWQDLGFLVIKGHEIKILDRERLEARIY